MAQSPLHLDPVQPLAGPNGSLLNPIGTASLTLDPARPVRYTDLLASTTYTDGRFQYLTDDNAMPARVRGVLERRSGDQVVRHAGVQAEIGRLPPNPVAGKEATSSP